MNVIRGTIMFEEFKKFVKDTFGMDVEISNTDGIPVKDIFKIPTCRTCVNFVQSGNIGVCHVDGIHRFVHPDCTYATNCAFYMDKKEVRKR